MRPEPDLTLVPNVLARVVSLVRTALTGSADPETCLPDDIAAILSGAAAAELADCLRDIRTLAKASTPRGSDGGDLAQSTDASRFKIVQRSSPSSPRSDGTEIGTRAYDPSGSASESVDALRSRLSMMAEGEFGLARRLGGTSPGDQLSAAIDALSRKLGTLLADVKARLSSAQVLASQFDSLSHDLKLRAAGQIDAVQAVMFSLGTVAEAIENSRVTASESLSVAADTQRVNEEMVGGVQAISGAMGEITSSTGSISGCVKMIQRIALETEILAINAAVEASRAGDAGRGFVIIAQEVRRLSNSTRSLARTIGDFAEASALSVQRGGEIVGSTNALIESVRVTTARIIEKISVMHSVAELQSTKVSELIRSVDTITTVSVENSQLAALCAEAAETHLNEAERMSDLMSHLSFAAEPGSGSGSANGQGEAQDGTTSALADESNTLRGRPSVELF